MNLSKNWIVKECDEDAVYAMSEALSVLPATAALLSLRGYKTKKDALKFLDKQNAVLHDAFQLPDMEPAVKRIAQAIENKEKIVVYGDYDVDGITGVSILIRFLRQYTDNVSYYIPDRICEGYGINKEAITRFSSENVNLVVTVDTGITASEEAALCAEYGIDMVITDHHECREELPAACAVINPKRPDSQYPFRDLAGVGVAFKLICAYEYFTLTNTIGYDEKYFDDNIKSLRKCYSEYADIVTLGTIADVMPVIDENRIIIAYGLKKMAKTKNVGLRALLKASGVTDENNPKKKITSGTVGFTLAPRINAVGRISKASKAVELFLTDDENYASTLAEELCELNCERQAEENVIAAEARKMIEETYDLSRDKIIVLKSDSWHHGVIGIVSSRITEKYNLPSIMISFDGDETTGKGSGRSISEFNLVQAFSDCSDSLIKYGGHALAAGLTVSRERVDEFISEIKAYAAEKLSDADVERKTYIDRELFSDEISLDLVNQLELLEPFGTANPTPVFLLKNLTLTEICPISQGKHIRLSFKAEDGSTLKAMFFSHSDKDFPYVEGDGLDIIFNLSMNEFKNVQSPQIIIRDVEFSYKQSGDYEAEINAFNDIKSSYILAQQEHIPTREDCAAVFRYIKKNAGTSNTVTINLHKLLNTTFKQYNYVKLRLIIEIFTQLSFISIYTSDQISFLLTLPASPQKADLSQSELYARIRN